jgi:UDP-N-acetylmuramate dehydrogenase
MTLAIRENLVLKPYTTFKMGGEAAYVAELHSVDDIADFAKFAEKMNLPFLILGGGSNIILPDSGVLSACVGLMKIAGFEIVSEDQWGAIIKIGAGEEWDSVVDRAVLRGLSGIEALSAIPGSAGATPVQNVGAYGQEIADVLVSLEAYDLETRKVVSLAPAQCQFSYRDSMFKHDEGKKYIITSITLSLSKSSPKIPQYPGVEAYFSERGVENPSLSDIRKAIIDIRGIKLPDPKVMASCGSFFKNPIVDEETAQRVKTMYSEAIIYPISENEYKIGAGWMIDKLGYKGREFGNLLLYPNNALVLVNKGGATREELEKTVFFIVSEIQRVFGITLEPEPIFVS